MRIRRRRSYWCHQGRRLLSPRCCPVRRGVAKKAAAGVPECTPLFDHVECRQAAEALGELLVGAAQATAAEPAARFRATSGSMLAPASDITTGVFGRSGLTAAALYCHEHFVAKNSPLAAAAAPRALQSFAGEVMHKRSERFINTCGHSRTKRRCVSDLLSTTAWGKCLGKTEGLTCVPAAAHPRRLYVNPGHTLLLRRADHASLSMPRKPASLRNLLRFVGRHLSSCSLRRADPSLLEVLKILCNLLLRGTGLNFQINLLLSLC